MYSAILQDPPNLNDLFYVTLKPKPYTQTIVDFEVSEWSMGSNDPNASDREKIAYFLSNLPERSLVPERPSIELLQAFRKIRIELKLIASWFLAGHTFPSNPTQYLVDRGEITSWEQDVYWAIAKTYENLWSLLTLKWGLVQEQLEQKGSFPFEAPISLFQEVVRTSINGRFLRLQDGWFEIRQNELKDLATLERQAMRGTLQGKDLKKFKRLSNKYTPANQWSKRLMEVLFEIAEDDVATQRGLLTLFHSMETVTALEQDLHRKPELKKLRGENVEKWRNGRKVKA